MEFIRAYIEGCPPLAWVALISAFVVLARCADIFVDSSVQLAYRLRIPKIVSGIVLVSLATTAPELSVSLMSALRGRPAIALGNAVGSVICDDGLALSLAALVATAPIVVMPRVLRTAGLFLIAVDLIAFAFVLPDSTLSRWEGAVLVSLFGGYIALLFVQHRKGIFAQQALLEREGRVGETRLPRLLALFAAALAGILVASEFVITSATGIARSFGLPDAIIAMTLVALGTSIPEVATCVAAARKREGAVAVGNILGADIMNICWVAGASAMANDLTVGRKEILFMFPAMFVMVGVMLVALRTGHRLTRREGVVLLTVYAVYLGSLFLIFPPL